MVNWRFKCNPERDEHTEECIKSGTSDCIESPYCAVAQRIIASDGLCCVKVGGEVTPLYIHLHTCDDCEAAFLAFCRAKNKLGAE